MKKIFLSALLAVIVTASATAQTEHSDWTLNTRAWSTNYFTTVIGSVANFLITDVLFDIEGSDSLIVERIVPMPSLVFPVGIKKDGFNGPSDIYGPYHRAFSNPFKHIGDYAIGLDASWQPSPIGIYAGAYFKSQEIVYKEGDFDGKNLRGFYFQPRAGIVIGGKQSKLEAGVFYDIVTGCRYNGNSASKDQLKEGLGLDFALSSRSKTGHSSFVLQFSMPLHNMLNSDTFDRRVGYIMLTRRIAL